MRQIHITLVVIIVIMIDITDTAPIFGQWSLSGNSVSSTDFLGTTNNQDLRFRTNNIEHMRLDTNGNLGVNVTVPEATLHVTSANTSVNASFILGRFLTNGYENLIEDRDGGGRLVLRAGLNDYIRIRGSGTGDAGETFIESGDNGNEPIIFKQTFDERMRIHSNGFVGIGDASPLYRLELPNVNDSTGQGRANDWVTYSSARWKENVRTLSGALDKIKALRGVEFDWKREHGGSHDIGFIAEEVGEVLPEVVSWEKDENYVSGISYQSIVPVTVEAIKELARNNVELQDRLTAQIAKTEKLGNEVRELQELVNVLLGRSTGDESTHDADPAFKERYDQALLFQNAPNPFFQSSEVRYFLPQTVRSAAISISTLDGKILRTYNVEGSGYGTVTIQANELTAGTYVYSLSIKGRSVHSRKMVLVN